MNRTYYPIIFILLSLMTILLIVLWSKDSLFILREIGHISHTYLLSIMSVKANEIPQEKTFYRQWSSLKNSYPYTAAIPIDLQNTGQESLFIGGGENQDDVLLTYQDGKLINIIDGTGLSSKSPTYGGVSIDMDKDGYSDLVIARQDGVTLYKNRKNGRFKSKKIMDSTPNTVPLAVSVVDFDKDGNADLYLSNFIRSKYLKNFQFNSPAHSKRNVMLKNISSSTDNLRFKDVTDEIGVTGNYNTFTSVFTDLNNDSYPDLVMANDAGEIEIFENKGGVFEKKKMNTGFGFWMGVAVGDYDQDGDQDLFLTNISNFTPTSSQLTLGGRQTGLNMGQKLNHSHVLLRNDGNFKFTDVTQSKMSPYYGFGWGATFEDIDLDTNLDLLFSTNYIDHPLHKFIQHSNVVLMNKDNKFKRTMKYPNFNYGQTPLTMDINNDQIKDVIWVNMSGPLKVYTGDNPFNHNFINIKLPNNINFTNAKVIVETKYRRFMKENIQGGIGFGGDQSEVLTFGLGQIKKVNRVIVKTIYGKTYTYQHPKINRTLFVLSN